MKKQNLYGINKAMKKKILASAILIACASGISTSAIAALPTNALLSFEPGVVTTSSYGTQFVKSGSYFGMDSTGDGLVRAAERTAITYDGSDVSAGNGIDNTSLPAAGFLVGTVQDASGSHSGVVDGTETPGLDSPWGYFGNTGMHYSINATNILSDDGAGNVTLDFSGWGVTWNAIARIDMSTNAWEGNVNGVADMVCTISAADATVTDCIVGTYFTLTYSATVPAGDPSGFGNVYYNFKLVGTVVATNSPPVAVNDTLSPNPAYNGAAVSISPEANDTDADGDTLTTTACTNGTLGAVVLNAGACSYTPNSNAIGSDSFSYTVSDGTDTATGTVSVTITDQVAPVITVASGTDIVEVGSTWSDAGASATDDVDLDATVTGNIAFSGAVDINTVATYTISYDVSDAAGNAAITATRTVEVTADATPPLVSITTGSDSIEAGTTWIDAGATATDNIDGSLAASVTANNLNNLVVGDYSVTYSATDVAGNTGSATRTVSVTVDATPPVVSITGGTDSIEAGYSWTDAGATAVDVVDGVLPASTLDVVDNLIEGTYSLSYAATDTAGNIGTSTRTVTVTADITLPVVTVLLGTDSVPAGGTWTDAGATALDLLDGAVSVITTGTVDTTTAGTYTVTYTATDAAGNSGTGARTVTITSGTVPVITINSGTDSVELGTAWTDAGATATDAEDATAPAVTSSGAVDINAVGSYTITYSATDTSGNTTTADRTVTVTADVTLPIVTITAGTDTIQAGASWTDAGATASDNTDGVITASLSSNDLDNRVIGSYTATYSATDAAGNVGANTRAITVIADATAPVISITTGTDSIDAGSVWVDAGATALDALDGTVSATTTDTVNTSVVGDSVITYTAVDAAGNSSNATRTVTVTADATAPVISITTGTDSIDAGSVWVDAGATALDALDGVVSATTTDTVDTSVVGDSVITYTAVDAIGNTSTASRTVTVTVDATGPVISITTGTDSVEVGTSWTDAGATAVDGLDGSVSATTLDTVDTSTVGSYTITYTASDAAGNSTSVTRSVEVTADVTGPVVTIVTGTDSVEAGSNWIDEGAYAVDAIDGAVLTSTSDTVNTLVTGTYNIVYSATDASANVGTATRTVTVTADATAPSITVLPGTDAIPTGTAWVDAGTAASDNLDASVAVTVLQSSLDTNTVGAYTITYSATDAAGNTGTASRAVTVTDGTPPVIMLIPGTDIVEAGNNWIDAGATASDNLDASVAVTTSGTVDTDTVGSYQVSYTASDVAGNSSTASRPVSVTVDVTAPVVTVTLGADSIEAGSSWLDAGAVAVDLLDGTLSAATSDVVDVSTAGEYTITYRASDVAGNTGTASRIVLVTPDVTAPEITLTSGNLEIVAGTSFNDPGAICSDNLDSDKSVVSEDSFDSTVIGTYVLTYSCTDTAGNNAEEVTRSVVVVAEEVAAAGCSMSATPVKPADAAEWWLLVGFIGFMAVKRGKKQS